MEILKMRKLFWVVNVLSICILVLVIINVTLILSNGSLKQSVKGRQYYINQSVGLNKLNNSIIRNLAELAAQKNDPQLKQLLSDHGITFTIKAPANGPSRKGEKIMDNLSLPPETKATSLVFPVFIIGLALLVMVGLQTYLLVQERGAVKMQLEKQTPIVEQSKKMRLQLDSIAKKTAVLSKNGNLNARAIVDQLKKSGITINTDA